MAAALPQLCTCSHPTALLQGFHRITQKRHVRVTQFVSLSSPLICSPRCAAGGPHRGGAIVTYEERSGFIPSGLPTTLLPAGRRRLLVRPINTSVAAAAAAGRALLQPRLVRICL